MWTANWILISSFFQLFDGFGYIWISQNVTNEVFLSEYVQRPKDQYVQLLTSSCMNTSKLTPYVGLKTQFVTEPYVIYLIVRTYRNVYAIFRSSAHCLATEQGRYTNIVKELFCPYCKNVIENELHFQYALCTKIYGNSVQNKHQCIYFMLLRNNKLCLMNNCNLNQFDI